MMFKKESPLSCVVLDKGRHFTSVHLIAVVPLVLAVAIPFFLFKDGLHASETHTFNRDLTVGAVGADVKRLQTVLNQNPDTRLRESGPGSPGQETEYFGPITRSAVIRFQEKHASEILTPLGLTAGTGYFGPSTRAKMASIKVTTNGPELDRSEPESEDEDIERNSVGLDDAPQVLEERDLESASGIAEKEEYGELVLMRSSGYLVEGGDTLYLYGLGFTDRNKVHFGDGITIAGVKRESQDTIKVTVPEDIEPGYYRVEVENTKGRTTDSQVFFVAGGQNTTPPRVERITPEGGTWGTEITVYGEGFDKEWNMLRAPYAILEGITSECGEKMTFKVEPFPEYFGPDIKDMLEDTDLEAVSGAELVDYDTDLFPEGFNLWPMVFHVVNDNGVDEDGFKFLFEFDYGF